MGQRLNIQIEHDGKIYANCYLHWDAYTRTALEDTKEILDFIGDLIYSTDSFKPVTAGEIIRNGLPCAGYDTNSINFYNLPTAYKATLRNNGLIGLTDDEIQETISWEEGRVTIDPIDRFISFDVFSTLSSEDLKDFYDLTVKDISALKELPFNIKRIDFKDFADFYKFLHEEIIDKEPIRYKNRFLIEIW